MLVVGQPMKKFIAKKLSFITQMLEEAKAIKAAEAERIRKRKEDLEEEIRRRAEVSAAKTKADLEAVYEKASASLSDKSVLEAIDEIIGTLVGLESEEEQEVQGEEYQQVIKITVES